MISDAQFSRLLEVALAVTHLGRPAQGRAMLEDLLVYRPGFPPALIGLAFNHAVTDDFEGALAILRDQVLARNPQDAQALATLGLTLKLAGRPEEAQKVLADPQTRAQGETAALVDSLTASSG
jgi:Flp pilus assembly protein TadD